MLTLFFAKNISDDMCCSNLSRLVSQTGKRTSAGTEGFFPTLFPFYSQAVPRATQTSRADQPDQPAAVLKTWYDMINARRAPVVKNINRFV